MLCLLFQAELGLQKRKALALALGCVMASAHAQSNGPEDLQQKLKEWISQSQRVPAESVSVTPMDARLKFDACQQPIQFDHPFSNRQTVRARCERPNWQHYLQVSLKTGQPATPAPGQTGLVTRSVWVTPQLLKRGTVLQASMFQKIEMALPASENQIVLDLKDVGNTELLRDLPANTPLRSYDLKATMMVRRGQQVLVSVGEGKGFSITVRAEAQQDGLLGDQIRLKNTESGRSLSAVVTGFNAAKGL
jgi:flagella basal body P-ring formation protein FlgA